MPRELSRQPVKKWSPASLRYHLTPEVSVSAIIVSTLDPLAEACEQRPSEFAYIVIGRVVNRSKADFIERRNVTPEALAAFLPLRDAGVPVSDRQLADAALAWIRCAVTAALGDREETKLRVTIWCPKGQKQLVSHRVTVTRAPDMVTAEVAPLPTAVAAASQQRGRVGTFISSNGPTWRAMIAEAELGGEPVGELIRGAAHVAEQAERDGVPQLPVSRETIEAMRRSPSTVSALAQSGPDQPSAISRHSGRFLLASRATVQRQQVAETELERALYRVVGRGLVGVVQVAADLSSATASVVGGVAGVVAGAR